MVKYNTVEDRDKELKRLEKQLKVLSNSYIDVGILQGTTTHAQTKGFRVKPAGLSMAEIGYQNEYGTSKIPARPFIGSTMNERGADIDRFLQYQINRVQVGQATAKRALGLTGLFVESLIKQKIRSITSPPNSPYTIALKGSSKPLIDFGQMVNSIAYVVVTK